MTSNATGGDRILGRLRSEDGSGVVRIEARLATTIEDLWSAITDPDRLAGWYGRVEGDLRIGGELRISIESDGWDGTGRVDACEPRRRLMVTQRESDESWRKGGGAPPSDEAIEARLSAEGDRTVLAVEVQGVPLDKIAFYGVGWQIHAENLAAYLAGRERGLMEGDATAKRWDDLIPAYQAMAADIGS